jgi:hypothetical protein
MPTSEEQMLEFPTWSDFEEKCANSRFWAGVHFRSSLPAGQKIGSRVAGGAHKFLMSKLQGK